MSNRKKIQFIRTDSVILQVTDPKSETVVMIVAPHQFAMWETDKTNVHYCSITDNKLYISSKAPYNYVVVHYAPTNIKTP